MGEVVPLPKKVMAIDQAVTTIEQLMLERVIEEGILACYGLGVAYEMALRDRYPYKNLQKDWEE